MGAIDYRLISTDDHVIEPRDVFEGRLPARFKGRAPRVVEEDGADVWQVEGRRIPQSGLSVMAGRKFEEYSPKAARFADMRPGCFDPRERLRDMDADGVEAEVLFPSLPGLGGQTFSELEDRDFAAACLRAYNEWMADSWCAADKRRLIGQVVVPLWDVKLAVAEVERGVRLGHKAMSFSATPDSLGFPSIGDTYWDPLWSAVEDAGIPVTLHIASGRINQSALPLAPGAGAPAEVFITVAPTSNFTVLASLVFSGVLERHPKLRFLSVEGGIGWLPYLIQRADETYRKHRHWAGTRLPQPPSFYFRRQVFANFLDDAVGLALRHQIGIDNLMFEVDYPHSDTTFPRSRQIVEERFKDVPPDETRKMVRDNAIRFFNLQL
jgi:predicted TIM-barrel fold metal-dependent hydrolase